MRTRSNVERFPGAPRGLDVDTPDVDDGDDIHQPARILPEPHRLLGKRFQLQQFVLRIIEQVVLHVVLHQQVLVQERWRQEQQGRWQQQELGWRLMALRLLPFGLTGVIATAGILSCTMLVDPAAARSLQSMRAGTGGADTTRVAIVVGNQDYASVPDLSNARKDAEDIAALFREFGFNVFDGYDLDKRGFEELVRTALVNIPEGADIVFYYAGHGIQIGRRNYLLPVDAAFESIYDVPVETMTLDRVIAAFAARGSAHVAILDSCRDNPFPDVKLAADLAANLFETRAGFDVFSTPLNSLVAFSTSPGSVARDGAAGGNSPYTSAILEASRAAPNENVQTLFPAVRERVHAATSGQQVPWESSTLVRPFYLYPAAMAPAAEPPAAETGDSNGAMAGPSEEEPIRAGGAVQSPRRQTITLNRSFDREIDLYRVVANTIGQSFVNPVLTAAPASGTLRLENGNDGTHAEIRYSPTISDVRAVELDDTTLTDSLQVELTTADGARRVVDIDLTLAVDPCDVEAGDALDMDGVGLYRLPNEIDITEALEACTAAVERAPGTARFHYQLGRVLQSAGRYEQAYEAFETAADAGHVRANYGLAVMLSTERMDRDVHGVPFDAERAAALLDAGVAANDPYAMHRKGRKLMRDGATEAERTEGFELLERSVELGHTFSMNELGIYFLTPDSGHYIPERGMRYLEASRDREDIYGYSNLGFVALNGLDGQAEDYDQALEMFQIASDGGHPSAPSMVARMILNDQVDGAGPSEALSWYDRALARGDAWGGTNGAIMTQQGEVPGKGPADAALRAARAALLPDDEAAGIAREILTELSGSDLNRATQMALNDLGMSLSVDGQIGPATRTAIAETAAGLGLRFDGSSDPMERLLFVSRLYWAANPIRFDLF